jgi:hypothetical protein
VWKSTLRLSFTTCRKAVDSIWLILTGLAGLATIPVPHVLMAALALIAGVLILVGR